MPPSEQRKYKRVKRICTVKVRLFKDGMDSDNSARWEVTTMQNLSASGMLFTFTEKFPIGAILEFNISSLYSEEPILCIGQVVRSEERQGNKISVAQIPVYLIAVFFKDIDMEKQEVIKKICGGS